MSNQALDLLIEYELLKSNGQAIAFHDLPESELSKRYSSYINARRMILVNEIEQHEYNSKLNAQFSTWSAKVSKQKTASSLLVYDKILLNDPLVSSDDSITLNNLIEGVNFFSWLYPLIRKNYVTVYPINFYNNPSKSVPLLQSDDAFKSSIPKDLHDFVHKNAVLKSVIPNDKGEMLVLREDAHLKRRTALNVGFIDDVTYSGVSLFLFQTLKDVRKRDDGALSAQPHWDSKRTLSEEKFNQWAYQAINQAILARLKAIYDQSSLSQKLGYTYVTESPFETHLLSLSGTKNAQNVSPIVKFMDINDTFIDINSPEKVIFLREKYPIAFDRFNKSLLSVAEELQSTEESLFEKKCASLFHKEILPQVDELRNIINQINTSIIKGTLASLGGITAAIVTGSVLPIVPAMMLSAAGGLTEAIPAISSYQLQKKKPAFIWHKIVKKT